MSLSRAARSTTLATFLLGVLVFTGGCSTDEPFEEIEIEPEALYFEPIGYGQRASLSDTTEVVIRSPQEWAAIRDSLAPIAPFDSVDFSQVIVLVAAMPQTTSGYAIDFASVDDVDTVVVAEYIVSVPADDCLTAFAESVPFQAVLVRRTDLPVSFQHIEEEYRCTFGPRRR